jgi:putative membrane protein
MAIFPAWRMASLVAGATVVTAAVASPLHHLAEGSIAVHMVQHMLLVVVGAPLVALGRPLVALAAVGASWARPGARRAVWLVRRLLTRPIAVWTLHAAVLWLWHAPGPYTAALADGRVHVLEHVTLLATGVLFWLVVTEPGVPARLGSIPAACYLLAGAMQCGVLGALLTLSDVRWYPELASTGRDPLLDQQLAGVLMWVPASLVYLGATLTVLAGPLRAAEPRMR